MLLELGVPINRPVVKTLAASFSFPRVKENMVYIRNFTELHIIGHEIAYPLVLIATFG